MARISIHLAEDAGDFEDARAMCRAWLDWHWRNYPDDWPVWPDHQMDPVNFGKIVQDLPKLHQRPRGGILLGKVDGRAAGCVMYHEADAHTAEFKRMFVAETGRGHGLGRRLLEHMFEQMIKDGYRKVMFSSATFLTHARTMYEAAGFTSIPHPRGFPDHLRDHVYFMERALA